MRQIDERERRTMGIFDRAKDLLSPDTDTEPEADLASGPDPEEPDDPTDPTDPTDPDESSQS